jgi:polysaccharide biosynthesis transport protein
MADLVTFSTARAASDSTAERESVYAPPPQGLFAWSPSGGFDLRQFLNVLKRRRAVILGWTALMTLIAGLVAFQLTPIYRAEAIVMLDTRKTEVLNVQAVVSGLPADDAAVRSEVEVLNSPALAARVVDKLDLTTNPLINTSLQPPSVWDRYNPITLLRDYFSPNATPQNESPEQKEQRVKDAAVAQLMNNVTIFNDGRSYIIKIRYESQDPKLAAQIANTYADQYLLTQLEAKLDATERATRWLNTHLAALRDKARDSDQAVQLYRAQHNLIGTKDLTVTTQQLSELNSQLIIATADETQKDANLRQIEALVHSGGEDSAAQVLASPVIQQLKAQEATLLQRRAELSNRYRPEYPEMINLQAQLNDVKSKIHQEINNVVRSMVNEVAAARARVNALTGNIQRLQQSAAVQDEAGVQLRELQREADANRALYENFLNRFKQTAAQEDIQQADAHLVSAASAPNLPSFPDKRSLILMAFALSLLTGVMIAFAIEHLDNGFRNADQIEKLAGTRFLGHVPAISGGKSPHQIVVNQPVAAYSEAIRSVRTALNFSNVDDPPKTVLVTSSLPNEGKTTLAASLALSVARSGGRAILIDCDLRHPSVGRLFGQPKGEGLLNLFKESADLAQMIQIDPASRLHYIPVQTGTSNPQDLLGSQHMKAFLRHLREQYDLIVLDAPPVLAVTDCLVLSHLVDAALFVVQWEQTPRQIALGALKLMQTQGANLAGVVLTRVNVRKHARYAFGDTGYYYGRYGTYYGKEG